MKAFLIGHNIRCEIPEDGCGMIVNESIPSGADKRAVEKISKWKRVEDLK